MIKGIILDVDGVLIGDRKGYNWPLPNSKVVTTLKSIQDRGISVSLCTGKGTFAIKEIVVNAQLSSLHIGDGGAVVINYLDNHIIDKHLIPKPFARKVVEIYQAKRIYIELYTVEGYYVQENYIGDITHKHSAILYQEPIIVPSLIDVISKHDIVKIMPIALNKANQQEIIATFNQFKNDLSLQWGVHPTALPSQFGIITQKGISKKQAAKVISKANNVPLANMLGIGDGMTDWEFIQLCGFAGAMGNASEELKEMVSGRKNGYIGKTVNQNGVLDILKHFQLI